MQGSIFLDIDLENQLIFIDELLLGKSDLYSAIEFLRNLCRAVRLPVNICSSDSSIRQMFNDNESNYKSMRLLPWVQVTIKTPQASILTFAHLIKFITAQL